VTGCVADPCNMGWPANDIRAVANSAFLDENPAVRALLEEAEIPIEDIFAQNALMNEGEDSEEDLQRHAEEWIGENQETFDAWLEAARAAANEGRTPRHRAGAPRRAVAGLPIRRPDVTGELLRCAIERHRP